VASEVVEIATHCSFCVKLLLNCNWLTNQRPAR